MHLATRGDREVEVVSNLRCRGAYRNDKHLLDGSNVVKKRKRKAISGEYQPVTFWLFQTLFNWKTFDSRSIFQTHVANIISTLLAA